MVSIDTFIPWALALGRKLAPGLGTVIDDAAYDGLVEAAGSYDPAKGSFQTYARHFVRNSVLPAARHERTVNGFAARARAFAKHEQPLGLWFGDYHAAQMQQNRNDLARLDNAHRRLTRGAHAN